MSGQINGSSPEFAGRAAAEEAPGPIVGARPCRISRPLLVPAARRGRFGRAWVCDLSAIRLKMPASSPPDAVIAHWLVEAPWSSEVVHSYSLIVVHLRYIFGSTPARLCVAGATHELALWAVNPGVDRAHMLTEPVRREDWLLPPVFGAQIVVGSDDAAVRRVAHAVDLVLEGRLSPHPAHVRSWAALFGDELLRRKR